MDEAVSAEDFALFQEVFHARTGIMFAATKRYYVDKRLIALATARRCRSVRSYLELLTAATSSEDMQALINAMTVNETYFWRESHQFRALVHQMLPEIVHPRAPGDTIKFWSVPCSTGEEPYSLAVYLLEHWRQVDDYQVEIVASDIDTGVMRQARAGIYDARSVQHVPKDALKRYFTALPNGNYQIAEALRGSIDFRRANLAEAGSVRGLSDFDAVFCRNLLIYFSDAARRASVARLYEALRPGGFCCLGHSESMNRISSAFTLRRFADALVYQKPAPEGAA